MSKPRLTMRTIQKHSKWNQHDDAATRTQGSIRRSDMIGIAQDERYDFSALGRHRVSTVTAAVGCARRGTNRRVASLYQYVYSRVTMS